MMVSSDCGLHAVKPVQLCPQMYHCVKIRAEMIIVF